MSAQTIMSISIDAYEKSAGDAWSKKQIKLNDAHSVHRSDVQNPADTNILVPISWRQVCPCQAEACLA